MRTGQDSVREIGAERFYGNIKPGFLPQAVDHFFVSFFAGILYAF